MSTMSSYNQTGVYPNSIVQPPVPRRTCGSAIASLILGIVAWILCLSILAALPAIICGHVALSRIKHSMGTLAGEGMAIAGLVLGYIHIVMLPVLGLLLAIAIPNFIEARNKAQRRACIANMKQLDAGVQCFLRKTNETFTRTVEMDDLVPAYYAKELCCPATQEPYVLTTNTVSCPARNADPEKYGDHTL